jgi:hypothetical protein
MMQRGVELIGVPADDIISYIRQAIGTAASP